MKRNTLGDFTLPTLILLCLTFCTETLGQTPQVSYRKFDVTDFGAIANDGMYDDASIQATIDAAIASGDPAVVYFPAGKYQVSSDNDVSNFIHIYGDNIVLLQVRIPQHLHL